MIPLKITPNPMWHPQRNTKMLKNQAALCKNILKMKIQLFSNIDINKQKYSFLFINIVVICAGATYSADLQHMLKIAGSLDYKWEYTRIFNNEISFLI